MSSPSKGLFWGVAIVLILIQLLMGWYVFRLWKTADATQSWLTTNVSTCVYVNGTLQCSDPTNPPPKPCAWGSCP